MANIIRRWRLRLAPPSPIRDPLDHPEIRRMTPHELDDLPVPRPVPRLAEKNGFLQTEPLCK